MTFLTRRSLRAGLVGVLACASLAATACAGTPTTAPGCGPTKGCYAIAKYTIDSFFYADTVPVHTNGVAAVVSVEPMQCTGICPSEGGFITNYLLLASATPLLRYSVEVGYIGDKSGLHFYYAHYTNASDLEGGKALVIHPLGDATPYIGQWVLLTIGHTPGDTSPAAVNATVDAFTSDYDTSGTTLYIGSAAAGSVYPYGAMEIGQKLAGSNGLGAEDAFFHDLSQLEFTSSPVAQYVAPFGSSHGTFVFTNPAGPPFANWLASDSSTLATYCCTR